MKEGCKEKKINKRRGRRKEKIGKEMSVIVEIVCR